MSTLPERHGMVLLPRFSLLTLSGAMEVLSAANTWLGQPRYQPVVLSLDGRPVRASCGTLVAVEGSLATAPPLAAAHVLADTLPESPLEAPEASAASESPSRTLQSWLRTQAANGVLLSGLGSGSAWLARAGLLAGYRATLHHAHVAQASEAHPDVVFSSNVYEIDRGRLSCGGGTASLDLFIAWLGRQHGASGVQALLTHFGLERLRARDERQRAPATARPASAKVAEAVALMEANLAEPLPTDDIARLVGVSRRQLERLFKQHLDDLPSRHYAELRLVRARRLLQHSSQSILQIALACGYSSASHFSNAYRARFGHTPRDERSQRATAWRYHLDDAATTP